MVTEEIYILRNGTLRIFQRISLDCNGYVKLHDNLFAVRMDGSWGAVDKNGVPILPFVFEHFIRIDGYTAFAKYNGAYGIIDLRLAIGE